ncbi:MAG: putative toxin [Anaerocolumna sp.]
MYTASDNIISKYITERGFHQHLVPLYTQYPDINDPTIKNECARAFLDGFCIGFYQGIIYGSMDWMATYKYEDSMAYARRIGRQGERASGIIKNHKHITSKTRSAEYRIPDGLDEVNGILSEVKNVKQLGYTKQLEDFYEYCQDNYYTFELYVRTTTKLLSKLRKLIEAGKITLKFLP